MSRETALTEIVQEGLKFLDDDVNAKDFAASVICILYNNELFPKQRKPVQTTTIRSRL